MIREKKGFTLVGLLATIIILGLLVTIAYVSVTSILDRDNDSYYESQENMLVLAGREYFAGHWSELPKEIGDTSTVTLETLIKEKYIDPIVDKDENVCDNLKSVVTAQKITDRDFQYYGILACGNYTTESDKAKPTISFDPNKKSSEDPITVTMKITDNKEVKSYRYVITKDGEEYQDSGYQTYDGDITINLTELGLYRITGYAIDSSGNTSTRRSGQYSVYKGIDCSQVQISSSIKAGSITNQDISISYKLPSNAYRVELSRKTNGGEYELIDSYIDNTIPNVILNTEGTHQVKAVVYDRDGNSCIAATDEYTIDKTGPELNVVSKKKTSITNLGNNADISNLEDYSNDTWYNGYVVLRGSCSDGSSKCDVSYKVTGASSNTDDFVNGTTRNINAEGVSTIEYRATDEAGNVTSRTYTVKLDRTAPTLSVVLKKKANSTNLGNSSNINSLKNYTNDTWYSGYVVLRGSCSDGGSDCTVSYDVTGASSNTGGFVNNTTRNINAQGTSTIVYRAIDEIGNVTEKTYTVKLDRTRPTVTYNNSGGTYKQKSLKVCATIKDSVGIDNVRVQVWSPSYPSGTKKNDSSNVTVNKTSKEICYTLSGYGTYTFYTIAYDYAGNKQSNSPENSKGYYYQTYTLKATNKKMYLCRDGDTFVHRRKSLSCSNTETNRYNCSVYLNSDVSKPKSVTVKAELDGNYYVLVDPIVKTFDDEKLSFKYIYKGCLTTDSTPKDCSSACKG